jgi:Lamin Tail Domain
MQVKKVLLATVLAIVSAGSSRAAIIISEVDPTGSSTTTYKADWFELTNTSNTDQDITGWKMDDNHESTSAAVALTLANGTTTIPAGKSVVFIEDTGTTASAVESAFESAWFGSNVPTGFLIGAYGGSSVGLSSTTDEVNIYDSGNNLITGVHFGASTSNVSFDNSAGVGAATTPPPTISTISVLGTNGAFKDAAGEIGSPGTTVPEPASLSLLTGATLLLTRRRSK